MPSSSTPSLVAAFSLVNEVHPLFLIMVLALVVIIAHKFLFS